MYATGNAYLRIYVHGTVCYSVLDQLETLTLSVLCTLLYSGPASPLYQALIDANIGSDFSPATG